MKDRRQEELSHVYPLPYGRGSVNRSRQQADRRESGQATLEFIIAYAGVLIPLTVPEVRAFLVAVLWQRAFTPETVLTFSKCGHRPLNSQTPPTLKPEAHPGKSGAVVSGTGSPCEPGTAEIGS